MFALKSLGVSGTCDGPAVRFAQVAGKMADRVTILKDLWLQGSAANSFAARSCGVSSWSFIAYHGWAAGRAYLLVRFTMKSP